jgi:ankyrin repeat protein
MSNKRTKSLNRQRGGMRPDFEFQQAIKNGNIQYIQNAIDNGMKINEALPNRRERAIHMAVRNGHVEVVRLLLDRSALIDKPDMDDYIPIHFAVNREHLTEKENPMNEKQMDIAKLLIERGADLNKTNNSRDSPLDIAARNGDLEMVKLLVENGANIEKEYQRDDQPLHKASLNGHLDVVKYLIGEGAKINDPSNEGLFVSPLHEAVKGGHFDVVKYLVDNGANINATNFAKDKPIHTMINLNIKPDYTKIAFFLMRKGLKDGTFQEEEATYGLEDVYKRIKLQDQTKKYFDNDYSKTSGTEIGNEISEFLGGKKNKRTQKRKETKHKTTKKRTKKQTKTNKRKK